MLFIWSGRLCNQWGHCSFPWESAWEGPGVKPDSSPSEKRNQGRSASFWFLSGCSLLLLFLHSLRCGFLGCSEAIDAWKQAFWQFLRFGPILFLVLVFPAAGLAWEAGRKWHWPRWLGVVVSCLPVLGMAVSVAMRLPTPAALFVARTGYPWPTEVTPGYRRSMIIYNVWLFHGEPDQIEAYLKANGFSPSPELRVNPAHPGMVLDGEGDPVWPAYRIAEHGPPWTVWGEGAAWVIDGGKEDTDPWGLGVLLVDEERRTLGVEWVR